MDGDRIVCRRQHMWSCRWLQEKIFMMKKGINQQQQQYNDCPIHGY